jgi:hypothetical protein
MSVIYRRDFTDTSFGPFNKRLYYIITYYINVIYNIIQVSVIYRGDFTDTT